MPRPIGSRWPRLGTVDRRLAAGVFSVLSIALLCTVAVARAPLPAIDARDPAAARDLVALMRAGEGGRWIVRYEFTRSLAGGRVLHEQMVEARGSSLHVNISGSVMNIEQRDRLYICNLVKRRSACSETRLASELPDSQVLRVAVSIGAYDVTRRSGRMIAGERARCFRVLATGHGGLEGLGVETDSCFGVGGVSLQERIVRAAGNVDERRARSVERHPTARQLDALIASFDPNATPPAG